MPRTSTRWASNSSHQPRPRHQLRNHNRPHQQAAAVQRWQAAGLAPIAAMPATQASSVLNVARPGRFRITGPVHVVPTTRVNSALNAAKPNQPACRSTNATNAVGSPRTRPIRPSSAQSAVTPSMTGILSNRLESLTGRGCSKFAPALQQRRAHSCSSAPCRCFYKVDCCGCKARRQAMLFPKTCFPFQQIFSMSQAAGTGPALSGPGVFC